MSRGPTASTIARRDAVLSAVRDGILVTTAEVCTAICQRCRERYHGHCYRQVYADFRALTKAGLVACIPANTAGTSSATWILTIKAREQLEATTVIEAMWEASR